MGSGAKIALVALLILMVVAVAKFVQNDSDEAAQSAAAKKDAQTGPRLSIPQPASATPNQTKRPVISSRSIAGVPAGKESPQAVPRPSQPAFEKPAPKSEPSVAQGPPAAPSAASRPASPLETTIASTLVPSPPRPPDAQRPEGQKSETALAQAAPPSGSVSRDLAPQVFPVETPSAARPFGPDLPPRPPARDVAALSSPPEAGSSQEASAFPQNHKVEPGDSYWRIAEKYYGAGKGKLYRTIADANGNANLIPGKTIKVPPPPAEIPPEAASLAAPARPKEAQPLPQNIDGEFEYVVQRGDSVSGLAKKFNRKQREIEGANPNLKYLGLRAGAKIVIPKRSS